MTATPDNVALIHELGDGQVQTWACGAVQRAANMLAHYGVCRATASCRSRDVIWSPVDWSCQTGLMNTLLCGWRGMNARATSGLSPACR